MDTGDSTITGTSVIKELACQRLESGNDYSYTSFPALRQSASESVQLLWWSRDCSRICINSRNGGLAPTPPRLETIRKVSRPDQHQWSLRTWQFTVGNLERTSEQSEFM